MNFLILLNSDLLNLIFRLLSKRDTGSLACTSRFFSHATKPIKQRRLVSETMSWLASGGCLHERIRTVFLDNPQILLLKVKVENLRGERKFLGPNGEGITAYQLALSMGKVEWVRFLSSLFTAENFKMTSQDVESIRQSQAKEQLPHGWVDVENTLSFDEKLFNPIIDTLAAATEHDIKIVKKPWRFSHAICEMTPSFRVLEDCQRGGFHLHSIVTSGKSMNHQNFCNAFACYFNRYHDFSNDRQRLLYCRKVIGAYDNDLLELIKKILFLRLVPFTYRYYYKYFVYKLKAPFTLDSRDAIIGENGVIPDYLRTKAEQLHALCTSSSSDCKVAF